MSEVAAGTVIGGKYRLDEPIGQGGMASVWRATHLALDTSVAVKVLDVSNAKAARMRERFEREAKLAANIKHRNIVDILDFGLHDDHPYMVMELLAGQSLGDRLEGDAPITDKEVFDIAAQVLSGLAAAHDAGVVHRDVKPDNVFLVRDADGVYPKILDFGISRDLTPGKNDTRVTNTGVLVGTPLYMSPEQARGLKDVDARTDLWSVGAMVYEALTGGLPFDSENMGDILIRIAMEDMPPIQTRRPDLPDAAAAVVMKALARDRSKRWQDARAMRDAMTAASAEIGAQAVRHHRSDDAIPLPPPGLRPLDDDDTSSGPLVRGAPRGAPRRIWPIAAGAGVLSFAAVAAVAFVFLGGEIRFRGEAAPAIDAAPAIEASPAEPAPAPAAEPAPTVVAAPEPPVEEEDTAPEPAPAADEPPRDAPPVVAEAPVVATRPARRGRDQAAPAEAEPTPPPARPAATEAAPEGGFLRDLDY